MSDKKTYEGIVKSNKMDKTIVVGIEMIKKHSLYKKRVKRVRKFKVHDEKNSAEPGDRVRIIQTRPISKDKYFKLVEIIGRGKQEK